MDEKQFELLMAKLEEIRCGLIDVEEEVKKSSQQANPTASLPRCPTCGKPEDIEIDENGKLKIIRH